MTRFDNLVSGVLREDRYRESIDGGLADGMSIKSIAFKHRLSVQMIKHQINKGITVELEHTHSRREAREIALDHVFEIPDYYDRLEDMEEEAKQSSLSQA
jgi:hypothetical protein